MFQMIHLQEKENEKRIEEEDKESVIVIDMSWKRLNEEILQESKKYSSLFRLWNGRSDRRIGFGA